MPGSPAPGPAAAPTAGAQLTQPGPLDARSPRCSRSRRGGPAPAGRPTGAPRPWTRTCAGSSCSPGTGLESELSQAPASARSASRWAWSASAQAWLLRSGSGSGSRMPAVVEVDQLPSSAVAVWSGGGISACCGRRCGCASRRRRSASDWSGSPAASASRSTQASSRWRGDERGVVDPHDPVAADVGHHPGQPRGVAAAGPLACAAERDGDVVRAGLGLAGLVAGSEERPGALGDLVSWRRPSSRGGRSPRSCSASSTPCGSAPARTSRSTRSPTAQASQRVDLHRQRVVELVVVTGHPDVEPLPQERPDRVDQEGLEVGERDVARAVVGAPAAAGAARQQRRSRGAGPGGGHRPGQRGPVEGTAGAARAPRRSCGRRRAAAGAR